MAQQHTTDQSAPDASSGDPTPREGGVVEEIRRLDAVDAFVVIDIAAADRADGIVRCARKVLVDSTRWMARSRTYSWAILGQPISGASAAVNAIGEGRDEAVAAFVAEVAPQVENGSLRLSPGKGVDESDLASLSELPRSDPAALVAGVLACIAAVRDPDGATIAVEHDGGCGDDLTAALVAAGATVVATGAEALGAEADVLLVGSSPGLVDHTAAADLRARAIVPTGYLPVTPRAQAVAARREITVLPDFLTTAGPLAARVGMDPAEALGERAGAAIGHHEGPVLGACRAAEEFLAQWVGELPFGRPIG